MKERLPWKHKKNEQETPEKGEGQREQEKKDTGRKSPWRFVFLGVAIVSGLWLAAYGAMQMIGAWVLSQANSSTASVGIIGGADGPTAIFVTSKVGIDWDLIIMILLLIVGIVGFLRLRKCKKK